MSFQIHRTFVHLQNTIFILFFMKSESFLIDGNITTTYLCEHASTDVEEKKLLNKVVIFVFIAHNVFL